jgi:glucokinase
VGDAITGFLKDRPAPHSCAIAAAGPVENNAVQLTNAAWHIDGAALSARLGCPVRILNDLAGVACALPHLGPDDLITLRAGRTRSDMPLLAVNVGTGFGASVAIPVAGGWHPLATEPGHLSMPDAPSGEVEDILSGRGHAALRETDDNARIRFSALLGRVVRDLVLATGAWGGVHFCGGVLSTWEENVDTAAFLTAFDRPGRMAPRLATVPLHRIMHPHPALLGLSRVAVA